MKTFRTVVLFAAATPSSQGANEHRERGASTSPTFAAMLTTTMIEATTTVAHESTTTSTPSSTTTTTTIPQSECTVGAVGTDEDFYRTACEQTGIAIAAAESVVPGALEAAFRLIAWP